MILVSPKLSNGGIVVPTSGGESPPPFPVSPLCPLCPLSLLYLLCRLPQQRPF